MRNFVPLILAVSGVFIFDQGHSSHQYSSANCRKEACTLSELNGFSDESCSSGDSLLSEYRNPNLDLNSNAIPSKDRLNRSIWIPPQDLGATYEVYTNRKRDGTSGYFSSTAKARHGDAPLVVVSHLHPNQKLYILVHGWRGSSASLSSISRSSSSSRSVKDEELAQIKDEILRVENATVMVVDWTETAKGTYRDARNYSFGMAYHLARFVETLVEVGALNASKVHYIGHSLGAQAARFFAQTLKCNNAQKIGRITGLDPAKEGFQKWHLEREDADFVDVIHTSTGIIELGMREPIGHVDFYPDGGDRQSGCLVVGCSHTRAKIYYLNSIQRCAYRSRCCTSGVEVSNDTIHCSHWEPSCGRMGHHASSHLRGVHYVKIDSDSPHCGL
uniref:Putative pancreatic lipase-like enzyme n=1 Tax=Ixodes ricinus TaxID=34613 RepID=V5H8Q4_IXORI